MKALVHYDPDNFGNLHCDSCEFDLLGKVKWGPHLIGHECPVCGADMLTVKDYLDTKKLIGFIDWLNKWFGWLGKEKDHPDMHPVSIKMHNGGVEIKPR